MHSRPEDLSSKKAGHLTRRQWLSSVLMGVGLVASYGTLAWQLMRFLLPARIRPPTRRLFVGPVDRFVLGQVSSIHDLEGNEILVKRTAAGFQGFNSVCPHLGCRVHWQEQEQQFFCPCHRGVFDAQGKAIAGPPAEADQHLFPAPLVVDQESGVVYLEVREPGRKKA